MAALIDRREIEVKNGDVAWKTIGAEATKTCGTLHRTIVLKSLKLVLRSIAGPAIHG